MRNLVSLVVFGGALLAATQMSSAELYYFKSSPKEPYNWSNLQNWSLTTDGTGAAPLQMAGNDFHTNGRNLGTSTSSSTFAGDSLTITSPQLVMRAAATYTFPSVTTAGNVKLYNTSGEATWKASSLDVSSGTTRLALYAGVGHALTFDIATLTGSGNIQIGGYGIGRTIVLSVDDGTAYTGTISWRDTLTSLQFGEDTLFGGGLTLTNDSRVTLDKDVKFTKIRINNSNLAVGTYTFEELNATYDTIFNDGGSGSLTVVSEVPEPATSAILGALLVGAAGRRRRHIKP